MHLKNGRSAGNGVYAQKETTSSAMVTSKQKVSFLPDGSPSPGNYGRILIFIMNLFSYCRIWHVQMRRSVQM
jgi:hypothetical protein